MALKDRVRSAPSESKGRPLSAWTRPPLRSSMRSRQALLLLRRVDGDVRRLESGRRARASTPQGCERLRRGQRFSAEVVRRVSGSGLTLRWLLRFVGRAGVVTRRRACEHPGTEPRNGVSTPLLHRQRRKLNEDWTEEPWQTPRVQGTGGQSRPGPLHAYVQGSSVITLSAARPRTGPTGHRPDYVADSTVFARKRVNIGDPTATRPRCRWPIQWLANGWGVQVALRQSTRNDGGRNHRAGSGHTASSRACALRHPSLTDASPVTPVEWLTAHRDVQPLLQLLRTRCRS